MDWSECTIGDALRRAARLWPDTEFLVDGDDRFTFGSFDRRVDDLCSGLLGVGLRKGDHAAIWLTNGQDWLLTFLAAARLGIVIVPINTRYKLHELEYILRQSDAKLIAMMDEHWGIDFYGMMAELVPGLAGQDPRALSSERLPSLRAIAMWKGVSRPGTLALRDLERPERPAPPAPVEPRDAALICYTSGTTGRPKGAMHSHAVLRQSANVARAMEMRPGGVVLGHMPFYHVAGMFMAILPAIQVGMRLVALPGWDVERALDLMEREGCTQFGGIPTHYIDCFDALARRPRDLSALHSAWIGGAAVTPDVVREARRVLGTPHILASYGMTENTISTNFTRTDDPPDVAEQNKGRLSGDYEAKIVDPASGAEVPAGTVGALLVRGHLVTLGYYKDEAATRAAFTADGWFHTDDLGFFDESGRLKVTGRVKEMFIVGGSNAYPAEIQQFLETHPDVRQSLVVGVPDRRLGQVGYAFVQLKPGASASAADLVTFCRAGIADYKVPRHVVLIDEFPMTESGKLKRHVLVDRAEAAVSAAA